MDYLAIAKRALQQHDSGDKHNGINGIRGESIQAPHSWQELLAQAAREPDARCGCGARANHLTRTGIWQCGRCAGFAEPEPGPMAPEMAAACAAYDRLHGQLLDLTGALIRARDAGETAEVARLKSALEPLRRAYREAGARVAELDADQDKDA